jgi:hypothetical protein
MLQIYYTGSDAAGTTQGESNKSLGGYISSTPIPNNYIGNLFPTISQLSQQEKREEIRVIAIQNDSGADFTSYDVYVQLVDSDNVAAEWEMGFQTPVLDDCGDLVVEAVPNANASPVNVTMQEIVGGNNKLILPNVADQSYVALYIKRTTLAVVVDEEADIALCDAYDEGTVPPTEEAIDLVLSYL